jgi:hypothetical protein
VTRCQLVSVSQMFTTCWGSEGLGQDSVFSNAAVKTRGRSEGLAVVLDRVWEVGVERDVRASVGHLRERGRLNVCAQGVGVLPILGHAAAVGEPPRGEGIQERLPHVCSRGWG